MSTSPPADRPGFSIACALGGSLAFSVSDVAVRGFSGTLPLHEVVLLRSFVALAFTWAVFARGLSWRQVLHTRNARLHAIRGACVVASNITYFTALAAMPLAETSGIYFVAPLLITALAALLLGERAEAWRWVALGVGLLGVMLILKPGTMAFRWVMLLPLLSALAYAGMHLMTRKMGQQESAVTMAVYLQLSFILMCTLLGLAFGRGQFSGSGHPSLEFLFRPWVLPGALDLLLITLAGVCSATGGFLMTQAYRSSRAGLVAPFEYAALVMAAFWGFAIWGEVPGALSAAGIGLILLTGVATAWRSSRP